MSKQHLHLLRATNQTEQPGRRRVAIEGLQPFAVRISGFAASTAPAVGKSGKP